MKEYNKQKRTFYKKHGSFTEDTRTINNKTHKIVKFHDGACWCEVYGKHREVTNVFVKGLEFSVSVYLFRIEYWSNENSKSQYAYERL